MTRQEFADKWGHQSGVGCGSAQFGCRNSLLKDLDVLIADEVKNLDLPHVSVALPKHEDVLRAAIEYDKRDKSNESEGMDNDVYIGFNAGVQWLINWLGNYR